MKGAGERKRGREKRKGRSALEVLTPRLRCTGKMRQGREVGK